MQSQLNPNESLTDTVADRRLTGWIRRSCRALRADIAFVDCASLDVLLYCSDDLVVRDELPSRAFDRVVES